MGNKVFSKNRFSKLTSIFDRFWCQLVSVLVTKIHQNPSKKQSQDASFFLSIFALIFFNDLGSTLEANLELCWPLRRTQDASKTPPRRLPRRSARHFSLLVDFCSVVVRFLIDFWSIFKWFSIDFLLIWDWFLKGFVSLFSVAILLIFGSFSLMFNWFWMDFW